MLLSEAIRLGPTVCPAIYGPVFEDWDKMLRGEPCGACRMGATAFVAGYRCTIKQGDMFAWMIKQWPLLGTVVEDPRNGMNCKLDTLIIQLHEHARWSADRIADYVETLESPHDLLAQPDQNILELPHSTHVVAGRVDK